MEFLGDYREVVEFLFGGVGVTLVGSLGYVLRKLKKMAARLAEEKAVSPGAALAMGYYENFLQPVLRMLAKSALHRAPSDPTMRFVLWMPEDMPLDPRDQRQYQLDLVASRNDIQRVTIESEGRLRELYGKEESQEVKLFDQPVAVTTLSYFSKVLDAAGRPKDMSEKRKQELHQRERNMFATTVTTLAAADRLDHLLTISNDPIALM